MNKEKLIETLEDLATFFALAIAAAKKARETGETRGDDFHAAYWDGRKDSYHLAFTKLDKIIKEAKR